MHFGRSDRITGLGQKQTCAVQSGMSALPPKADMCNPLRAKSGIQKERPPGGGLSEFRLLSLDHAAADFFFLR